MMDRCAASGTDGGAARIVGNYAAVSVAWSLLCEFAGIASSTGDFVRDLVAEMNHHIIESVGDRRPWVGLMEVVLGQIDSGEFRFPYKFEVTENGDDVLAVRCTHIMQHLSQSSATRAKFDSSPVKSAKVLHKQLIEAGVILEDGRERTIQGKRVAHLHFIGVKKLEEYGLAPSVPEIVNHTE